MRHSLPAAVLTGALLLTACGGDDGAEVRTIGTEGGGSVSGAASGSSSGSASGVASGSGSSSGSSSGSASGTPDVSSEVEEVDGDGGYDYASDVNSHRLVVRDVCDVKAALDADPVDFEAAATAYRDGMSSPSGDGFRTLAGFATRDDRSHGLDDYYGTPTPLDDFVTAALEGTGLFEGEADGVRAQGVEKGIQNQVMVAWVVHELNSALAKADEGDFEVEEGAPHNWDEAWAFYHGAEPDCAPYATAESRAGNFGTVTEGETALANEAIVGALNDGLDALLAEDAAGARAAADEVVKQLVVTYSQAAVRYASLAVDDVAARDLETAREHQVEGLAFFRVIESIVAENGADVDTVNDILGLDAEPAANGDGDDVRAALQPAWDALGITADDIGTLQ